MGLSEAPYGSTPLLEEDAKGLIPKSIFDRETLNLVEAENIMKAKTIFLSNSNYRDIEYLLSDIGLKEIHKLMFDDVWSWAGKYRTHDTNIGAPFTSIQESVHNLLANYRYQYDNILNSDNEKKDEYAVKFHYDLVCVHPFANGNGRHSRQMADLILNTLDRPVFSWNESAIIRNTEARKNYIKAIEYAQNYDTRGDVSKLLKIAREK